MYINPFALGVIFTLAVEALALWIAVAVAYAKNGKRRNNK
jgi:hypothetical protein